MQKRWRIKNVRIVHVIRMITVISTNRPESMKFNGWSFALILTKSSA